MEHESSTCTTVVDHKKRSARELGVWCFIYYSSLAGRSVFSCTIHHVYVVRSSSSLCSCYPAIRLLVSTCDGTRMIVFDPIWKHEFTAVVYHSVVYDSVVYHSVVYHSVVYHRSIFQWNPQWNPAESTIPGTSTSTSNTVKTPI